MKIWKPASSSCEVMFSKREEIVKDSTSANAHVEKERKSFQSKEMFKLSYILKRKGEKEFWKDNLT